MRVQISTFLTLSLTPCISKFECVSRLILSLIFSSKEGERVV